MAWVHCSKTRLYKLDLKLEYSCVFTQYSLKATFQTLNAAWSLGFGALGHPTPGLTLYTYCEIRCIF